MKRQREFIVRDMLKSIILYPGIKPTNLIYKANINSPILKETLPFMEESKLLINKGGCLYITPEGLQQYVKLCMAILPF